MDCPSCSTSIPNDARFCPHCGSRFSPTGEVIASPSDSNSTPAPNANGDAPPTPAEAVSASPKSADAAGDDAKDTIASGTRPTGAAFELGPSDFARAFERAKEEAGIDGDTVEAPHDPESLHAAGVAAGIDRKVVQRALHRVSMEKLPADVRAKMGIVLDDEVPPAKRNWWLPLVALFNLVIVVVVVWLVFFRAPTMPEIDIKPQKGTLDVAALEAPVTELSTAAQACYQAGLKENSKLGGEVVLTIRVNLDATVSPTIASETLGDAATVSCIVAAASAQAWPAAKVAPVDVDIPLKFQVASEN